MKYLENKWKYFSYFVILIQIISLKMIYDIDGSSYLTICVKMWLGKCNEVSLNKL